MLHLGVYVQPKDKSLEETQDFDVIPSEDMILSNILQRAIDGDLPKHLYDFPETCIYDWKYEGNPQQGCGVFSSKYIHISSKILLSQISHIQFTFQNYRCRLESGEND